ncbi:MAG: divalent-cation tolerance protein CutA [Calditrichaeota bacterium]|nr:MAG: divalent-cation tolerance protein CutA [Calditrichota bacterium]
MKNNVKSDGDEKNALVAFSTTGNIDDARKIARELINRRLVACVNIIPQIESVYSWENEVCHDNEVLLVFKTTREHTDTLKKIVPEIHPYEVPELIFLPVVDGAPAYLQWVCKVTEK